MMNIRFIAIVLLAVLQYACSEKKTEREVIDLQGEWRFALDEINQGENDKWYQKTLDDRLLLPGTTDTNRKGKLNEKEDETTYLTREYSYIGQAWYQKDVDIPDDWKDKHIQLTLERSKLTKIWIDDTYAGSAQQISTKQEYDLSGVITPGKHTITILVDNTLQGPMRRLGNSHAFTESTQTNWNGIIGEIKLEAVSPFHIRHIEVYPDAKSKSARIVVKLNRPQGIERKAKLLFVTEVCNTDEKYKIKSGEIDVKSDEVNFVLTMKDDALLWDEFDPIFYQLNVKLQGEGVADSQTVTFGLRDFKTKGTQFTINGLTTFLRGKHDGCVFPLTAHTAMDTATWRKYFRIAKSYGINHYRFHSWCPPEACFEAADVEGVYLQPELPYWGGFDRDNVALMDLLKQEGLDILNNYGNHPSFVMFSLGNELGGDREVMSEMVDAFRKTDGRHLYSTGSNNYLGFNGYAPGDDYFTTCRVAPDTLGGFNTHVRGSFSFADATDGGLINHAYPNTVMNFDSAVLVSPIPIVSHETGQFQIYPNYPEMRKYTGVLKPNNFATFKNRLKNAGMEQLSKDFFLASGIWSTMLYRADIEMDLRTKNFGGFQLLDLQDYPGQGSAFIGILDAFMDNKGLITPEEWRAFCSEVVPMFETEKFCYTNKESLTGNILIANYSKYPIENTKLEWILRDSGDKIYDKGSFNLQVNQGVLANIGKINPQISTVKKAQKLTLTLSILGTKYKNSYSLWIFPNEPKPKPKEVKIVNNLDAQTRDFLRSGGKVLWFPDHKQYEKMTVGGLFQTDYWNYRMFKSTCENNKKPVSPGTLGLLINPGHQVFNHFPTDFYTDWQWFSIIKESRPFIMDNLSKSYLPIVQVIDNVERNHKLGLLFELEVDGGLLLICMSNLPAIQDKPEARQLLSSILSYMDSNAFDPKFTLTYNELSKLFQN
jgi:hypothetical protein